MSFEKISTFSSSKEIKALNTPKNWEIFNLPKQIKYASTKISEDEDLNDFDLKEAISKNLDHLYVKIFAIKKDEVNDNGDAFSARELKKAAPTFIGVPLFTNHQNDDVEKARGICVHSWYDDKEGGIYIIDRVDKVAYPKLARGIETGIIVGSSMGTSVQMSICSICHNAAATATEFCDHISGGKNRKFSGKVKCQYHKSNVDDLEDKCPLCDSTKDDQKTIEHEDIKIFEHNYGLKFIENSFVVNPACHDCGVKCVLHIPEVQKKVASLKESIDNLIKHSNGNEKDVDKFGGIKELDSLKNSMTNLETVVQSMVKQKEKVSIEYVSDLVKAMADVQNIFDELVEMGYGALPSPNVTAETMGEEVITDEQISPVQPQSMAPISPPKNDFSGAGIDTGNLNGLGNITKPKISSKKIEDFIAKNRKTINKISSLRDSVSKLKNNGKNTMANIITEVSDNSNDTNARRIIISKSDNNVFITEAQGQDVLTVSNINQFSGTMQKMINENPQKAGEIILNDSLKNIGVYMNKENLKTAADKSNQDIITEKQLEKKSEPIGSRTDKTYEGITESQEQLSGEGDEGNDTTSESPQRHRGTYSTITEDQLEVTSECINHFDNTPDVITEKQWTDMSRLVSAKISDNYTDSITEKQLAELLSGHKFIGDVDTITEDQLNNISMQTGLERWASSSYATSLMKVATGSISDAISVYHKSPEELMKVASFIINDDNIKNKSAFLSIINSLPYKKEERIALSNNVKYFNKIASTDRKISGIDALILSVAANSVFGHKAEDVFDSIDHALRNKIAMAKVNSLVQEKMSKNIDTGKTINKYEAFDSAIKTLDKPEDGLYRIKATIEDIGVPLTKKNKVAFLNGIKKLAQEQIDDDSVAAAVIKIEVGENGELIIDIQDGAENEIVPDDIEGIIEGPVEEIGIEGIEDEEIGDEGIEIDIVDENEENDECLPCSEATVQKSKIKLANAKKEITKKAQMMGGEMGGMGGASQAPGAGASMPMPPGGAQAAPVETFTEETEVDGFDDIDEDSEPSPPGTYCPVCGSKDVDIMDGKGKCNSCNAEADYKIQINVTKWPGVTPDTEEGGEAEEGEELGEGGLGEGEGFELPEEPMPAVAAMIRLKPNSLKKIAESNIKLGSISPATGKNNTMSLGEGNYFCLDTGTKYKVSYVTNNKGNAVWGQWEWVPKTASSTCPSCQRAKQRFIKALSTLNLTEDKFNKLELNDKIDTIVKLKKAGALKTIKTADKNSSIIADYKLAYGNYGKKFPIENCMEKLARRYGQNALALSGPCEGKPLAECICNQLSKAGLYTDKVAMKLAETWSDCDGDEECITDQVRGGHSLREAASICETLKIAVAGPEDMLADEFSIENGPVEEGEEIVEDNNIDEIGDVDPFEAEEANVTIEIPKEVAEQLKDSLEQTGIGEEVIEEEVIEGEPGIEGEPVIEEITPEELETKPVMEKDITETGDVPEEENNTPIENDIAGSTSPCVGKEKVVVTVNGKPAESDNLEESNSTEEIYAMKDNIKGVGKISMDLSAVMDVLKKTAGEKTIEHKNVQDSKDIGSYTAGEGGSLLGHENETIPTAKKPSVPRNNATIGQEDTDLNPADKPQPEIPSDKALIGNESEDLAGGDATYTGGDKGQGKTETTAKVISDTMFKGSPQTTTEDQFNYNTKLLNRWADSKEAELAHMRGFGSSRDSLTRLADNIRTITADNKKLDPPKPVADDPDIQPIKDNGTIGKEEKFDAKEPENVKGEGNTAQIGHENEAIGDRPDSPKDMPEIPANNQLMGDEGKDISPEKQTKDKGTVIATNNTESEAYRVAGKMLEAGIIQSNELQNKVAELKQYKPAQITDFETAIFAGAKGLDTVTNGMSQAVVINETSSLRNSQTNDLSKKLTELFTLGKQNKMADDNTETQLRKNFGKN